MSSSCIFCQIARSATSTILLHQDDRVVAFQDINPSAFRFHPIHYPLILCDSCEQKALFGDSNRSHTNSQGPAEEIRRFFLSHSHVTCGSKSYTKKCASREALQDGTHKFGFHQPPFNSVNHLHLHCLALPFTPKWRSIKYLSLGPLGGFLEAEKLLERINPLSFL